MKILRVLLLSSISLFLASNVLARQGVNARADSGSNFGVHWLDATEGLKEARSTNKKVLVDICAKWCPWCKQMDEKVYGANEVADYIAKKYVPIKLNGEGKDSLLYQGERMTESSLADELGTKGYPTTVFLNFDGEFMVKLDGYMDKELFLKVLEYIGEDIFEKKTFTEFAGTSLSRSDASSSSAREAPHHTRDSVDTLRTKQMP